MPRRTSPGLFKGAVPLGTTLLLLLCLAPIPAPARQLVGLLVAAVWLTAAGQWLTRRYGNKARGLLAGGAALLAAAAGVAYWRDAPNRHLVAQVEQLGAADVGTTGTWLTGRIEYVYFKDNTTDEQVRRFIELDGLDDLRHLIFKGTPLSDVTARRLGRFTGLRFLSLEGARITDETVARLEADLPRCVIEAGGRRGP